MYKSLQKNDYIRLLGLEGQEINGLVVYGGFSPTQSQVDWCSQASFKLEKFFYPLFIHRGIAVTNAYGDAMASEIAHIFSVLGVKKMVLFGTFGATQPGIDFGKVFLPTSAIAEDGASRVYSAKTEFFPDQNLLESAKNVLTGVDTHQGKIVSISAMLGETWEMICDWKDKGYTGVDLETASFLAVASHFEVPAIAMHTLADNLVEQKTIIDVDEDQHDRKSITKNLLFKKALELVSL